MSDKKASKQIVVNVSEESKAKITELKKQYEVTDKEFIDVLLEILDKTDAEVVTTTIQSVTVEKQKAKIEARLRTLENKIAKAKAELGEPEISAEVAA